MFTGLITDIGEIISSNGARITIASHYPAQDLAMGESIACSGVCLTVVEKTEVPGGSHFTVELSQETIDRSVSGMWEQGKLLNLERALRVGDRLGGHFVTGHVDGVATLQAITPGEGSYRLDIEAPEKLSKFIAAKGSVTLDGVSLTVNEVNGSIFSVMIIPHTWAHTTLGSKKADDSVNVEIDMIARYLERFIVS